MSTSSSSERWVIPIASISCGFHESKNAAILGGSATPGLTLKELVTLSSDPEKTRSVFSFDDISLGLGSAQGSEELRQIIATTYDSGTVTPSDVIVANSTTGSNHIVYQSLLGSGDHVICQYPMYGPCIEEPLDIGCDISYLHLNPGKNWEFELENLKDLIRPGKTKMLVLNNPSNPTGTHLSTRLQREIIALAKEHDIIVHADEIFRPMFYNEEKNPTSMIENPDLGYDKIVTTSSLSKAYGLSGIRVGWICTRSAELHTTFMSYRVKSCSSVSKIDEAIAAEALGPRCRPGILKKHITLARTNIDLIQDFIDKRPEQCEWVKPTSGAVAFVKFKNYETGQAVDDVAFCERLYDSKMVLLSPATKCFEFHDPENSFKGRCRFHFTVNTEILQKGLQLLGEFLDAEKSSSTNGTLHG